MNRTLRYANLPESKVKSVILGQKYKDLTKALDNIGISIVHVPDNKDVLPKLSGHADLSLFHKGGSGFIISRSVEVFAPCLRNLGFDADITSDYCAEAYPCDVGLNACLLKNRLFVNKKYCDEKILKYAAENNVEIINVNQGYAKCSICTVDERHIITEDKSVHKAAIESGVESLLISPGYIKLEGFDYGFIGGASGKLDSDILAFTGTLDNHPDRQRIIDYLIICGVKPLYLTNEPCYDVGSILPITEKEA